MLDVPSPVTGLVACDEFYDLIDGCPAGRGLRQSLVGQTLHTLLTISGDVATKGPGADAQHSGSIVLRQLALSPNPQNLLKMHFPSLLQQLRPSHVGPPSANHEPDKPCPTTADTLCPPYSAEKGCCQTIVLRQESRKAKRDPGPWGLE